MPGATYVQVRVNSVFIDYDTDFFSAPDLYVKARVGNRVAQTSTALNSYKPVWNEDLTILGSSSAQNAENAEPDLLEVHLELYEATTGVAGSDLLLATGSVLLGVAPVSLPQLRLTQHTLATDTSILSVECSRLHAQPLSDWAAASSEAAQRQAECVGLRDQLVVAKAQLATCVGMVKRCEAALDGMVDEHAKVRRSLLCLAEFL